MRTHAVEKQDELEARERAPAPLPPDVEAVLALQRSAGNRAVANVLARGPYPKREGAGKKTEMPRYLQGTLGALYGLASKSAGGSSAEVTVGPAGGDPANYGSGPQSGECTAVEKLNENATYSTVDKWIKGHLLNDNLGGPGISKNLTPMTSQANKAHSGSFEGPVKRGIVRCRQLGNPTTSPIRSKPAFAYWYGVAYDVRTDGKSAYPGAAQAYARAVHQNLICNAKYVKEDKANPIAVVDLTATEISDLELPALPAANHSSPCV